ncbi:MAG: glycosyltransferase family 39 protein, partial [Flavobacteriales bacterium]|nr:glycosyltransferase family 39 protein [Flavobacteriales bacterium]
SKHMWRQADGLSVTLNYYEEGMKFWSPRIHSQLSKEGKGIQEFPILYYTNALVWQIIGQSEGSYRLLNILLLFLGLLYLFKIGKTIGLEQTHSILLMTFAFTCPVLIFYGASFLPNVPAFCISLAGIYYYLNGNKSRWFFALAFSLLTLAVLIRFSLSIFLMPFYLHFIWQQIRDQGGFFKKVLNIFLPLSSGLICLTWLLGVKWFNEKNDSWYFLTEFRPLWKLEQQEIREIWDEFLEIVLPEYHYSIVLIVLGIVVVSSLFLKVRSTPFKLIRLFVIYQLLAGLAYIVLWYKNFSVHDYYMIDLMYLILGVFALVLILVNHFASIKKHLTIALLIFVCLCFAYGMSMHRLKYFEGDRIGRHSPLIPQKTKDLWNWWHWNYRTVYKAHEDVKPFLRGLGISREDLVVSLQDQSPNITLYLMDQKGFTDLFRTHESRATKIEDAMKLGAKYLILNTNEIQTELKTTTYLDSLIGTYKNLNIYQLQ